MTKTMPDAVADIDRLGRGEIDPGASLGVVRTALEGGDKLAQRLYTAFRDLVWRALFSRDTSDDLASWHNVLTYSVSLSRRKQHLETATQLKVLAELVAQSARYAQLQPDTSVVERKHVPELLKLLAKSSVPTPRTELYEKLQLADANLSRVLNLVVASLLARRTKSGKAAAFSLTEAGRQAAAKLAGGVDTIRVDVEALPMPVAVWSSHGHCLAANSSFRELNTRIGFEDAAFASKQAWLDAMHNVAIERAAIDQPNRFEMLLPESRSLVGTFSHDYDIDVCAVVDVSAFRARQTELEDRLLNLDTRVKGLVSEVAELKHRDSMRRNLAIKAHQGLADMTAIANSEAQSLIHSGIGSPVVPRFDRLASKLSALSQTVGYLMKFYDPLDRLAPSSVNVGFALEKTVNDFRALYDADVILSISPGAKKAWVPSQVDTAFSRVMFTMFVGRRYHAGSFKLHAKLDRNSLRCAFVMDDLAIYSPSSNELGSAFAAPEDLKVVLEDLNVNVSWDESVGAGKSFNVIMPLSEDQHTLARA